MRSSAFIIAILVLLNDRGLAQNFSPGETAAPSTADPFSARQNPPAPTNNVPPASRDTSGPAPVYSRVANFTIPFSVTQAEKQGLEVLLFVSHDFGATWTLYNRQPASQGQFAFRTNQDGEYWFASRTIPIGTVISAGATFRPELRVVVDTAPPRLDVQAGVDSNGKVQLEWQAVDDLIAPETLKIEYQQALGKPYQAVQATGSAPTPSRNGVSGRASWTPDAGSYFVSIRVQVGDKAGNTQEVTRRLIIPISLNARPQAPTPNPASTPTSVPADPLANYGMTTDRTADSQTASTGDRTEQQQPSSLAPQATAWPSEQRSSQDPLDPYFTPDRDPQTDAATPAGQAEVREVSKPFVSNGRPASGAGQADQTPFAETERDVWNSGAEAALTDRTPATASASQPKSPPGADRPAARTPAVSASLPKGERPRMTNSKRFNLDYSVDAVGPSGVEKVELWVTRNGGRDWDLGWLDEDLESPLLVEVENEGIYGFRVVVVGRNGLASQSPRAGDLADLWVGVDVTKPIAEITSAAYGSDSYAGQLDIRWNAVDDHLGSRPVSLSFSEKPDGPWTPIASGLPNNGQYLWRVDSRVPGQFYLRLEVRDEAGNVAVHRLDEPLQSAGLTPKGSVRGFAPAGG